MPSLSTTIILKALDCLALRAAVSAENIANAGTSGYRPLRVSFEKALIRAADAGRSAVKALQPRIELEDTAGPEGMRLDLEVASASATAMRYAALIEILNRRMQQDSQSVSGNA